MEVEKFDDAVRFREQADALLLKREARNNLILGVTQTIIDRPDAYDGFEGWVVHDDRQAVAAAARTLPWKLMLAESMSKPAIRLLAESVEQVPGVVGNCPWIDNFVEARGGGVRRMSQGVFELTDVIEPRPAAGRSRLATPEDLELLVAWTIAFSEETAAETHFERLRAATERRVAGPVSSAAMWIHEVDGEPVSMSGHSGPTPNGIRIGPVYTPPQNRGHGYASALVATQSKWLLAHGKRFCFLYTDLANTTSNDIYKRIGYRQIAESAEYLFSPSP